ncbi:Csu type fimbrial protein [Zavarzinia sp. CC-PAN008]|uniref:Csu type fimbrial protein n=1 Tax=Zavarzinia sp. CC-PAN008 TaxID=3243332 RepID=UPI003F743931
MPNTRKLRNDQSFLPVGGIAAGLLAAAALLLPVAGHAASSSSQFTVSATVSDECAVNAADLNFGTYSINSSAPLTATSTIGVTCTTGTAYSVKLDGGAQGNVTGRQMSDLTDPAKRLSYQLYSDVAYTVVWGDGTNGTAQAGTGSGSTQSLTVRGRIPAQQAASAGSYRDTITVTVTY